VIDSGDQAATGAGAGSGERHSGGSRGRRVVVVGPVVGAQGLQGELRMLPDIRFPGRSPAWPSAVAPQARTRGRWQLLSGVQLAWRIAVHRDAYAKGDP